ncbi:DNA-directed RNA polymerase subunit RPC12/RpoP/uncharacterized protein YacL [Desulfofundulus luciae]|uniref:DNA-directed RNA polymerase subunit RPC12/RpoP/uncharacterized protein YacL n=1 Tax=Desulfofundulus luciae TaxID=74702 RepID=A0ABU0B5G0_9FIRM|nr:zinc ribbon domain-containing protein [Desulfofundulus luciae]MDQ0287733.1 DNA-directed RNA polymerase subunit RPC12/RpoP/uncharacterized protein YacL [Desulfofundulus luciae]
MNKKEVNRVEVLNLMRRLVGFFITLIILIIIKAIVVKLPSMDATVFEHISIAGIASAIISIIIIGMVLVFGQDIAVRTARILPAYPEATQLLNTLFILIAIIIAYSAFDGLLVPFLAKIELTWLYPVLFLLIAILPVYRITALLFTSSGKIADLFMGERQAAAAGDTVVCSSCGNRVPDAKFCSHCGKELVRQEVSPITCRQCGAKLNPGTKFCVNCGAAVAPEDAALRICPACNSSVEPGDEFCSNCGTRIS